MSKNQEWIVGLHAVNAVLELSPQRIKQLWCARGVKDRKLEAILNGAASLGLDIQYVDRRVLSQQCGYEQHQGIAALAFREEKRNENHLESLVEELDQPLLLVLDQVQDPHNFGACLRSAEAAGVDAVVVAKDHSSPMTPVVSKVASGAAESMPVFRVTNLARTLDKLKSLGVWLIGTSDQASSDIYRERFSGALALVMGAEGRGLRDLTAKKCDVMVSIPMHGRVVSSLNVSVATGVCLYEIVRQRSLESQN